MGIKTKSAHNLDLIGEMMATGDWRYNDSERYRLWWLYMKQVRTLRRMLAMTRGADYYEQKARIDELERNICITYGGEAERQAASHGLSSAFQGAEQVSTQP